MAEQRESARIKINERVHVIDEATRNRRQRKALDALEKDNFQDELPQSRALPDFKVQLNKKLQQRFSLINDPDANEVNEEVSAGNTPLNSSSTDGQEISRKRKLKPESKLRHRKNYTNLLEEERSLVGGRSISYFTINVGPSKFPPRKFCSVCGFPSPYICIQCGTKYCSKKCLQTHKETRCLKWTA